MENDYIEEAAIILTGFFFIFFYLLPAIIASNRNHHNKGALLITNIFIGWTGIGWIICLIWSFTNPTLEKIITVNNSDLNNNSFKHSSVADELNKLSKLKSSGVLTDEEFKLQKDKLLK